MMGEGSELGERELQVALYVVQELTYDQIAAITYVSKSTVKSQVKAVCRKLGCNSRAGIVRELYEQGFLLPRGSSDPRPVDTDRRAPTPPT